MKAALYLRKNQSGETVAGTAPRLDNAIVLQAMVNVSSQLGSPFCIVVSDEKLEALRAAVEGNPNFLDLTLADLVRILS